jgi:hypothetical protein
MRFLRDFCHLMASAHYRLLGKEVWDAAQSEEFLVGEPSISPMHEHELLAILLHFAWPVA